MRDGALRRQVVALVLSAASFACGSESDDESGGSLEAGDGVCAKETRAKPYSAGLKYVGAAGLTVTLLESTPAPPRSADNVWTLQITDATGAAVLGATVALDPRMVDHGHGSCSTAVVTELTDGKYRADPVNLCMVGFWETTVSVTAGAVEDEVKIGLCVE